MSEYNLCSYGCGNIATFQFKNGKWCCCKNFNSCPNQIIKTKEKTYEKIYGIEKAAELINLRRKAFEGDKNPSKKLEARIKMSKKLKGKKCWCKGLTKETNLSLKASSEKMKKTPKTKEHNQKNSISHKGKTPWNKGLTKETNLSLKLMSEKLKGRKRPDASLYMINGGSCHASSFIKNPSKPQVSLYNLTKEIFPEAILNYPVEEVNKNLDIAIPSLMIAIEYDGSYWHKNKEDDDKRQKLLESFGWKFIRYRDRIPSSDGLLKDIQIIRGE
jgi:hypothetical protein